MTTGSWKADYSCAASTRGRCTGWATGFAVQVVRGGPRAAPDRTGAGRRPRARTPCPAPLRCHTIKTARGRSSADEGGDTRGSRKAKPRRGSTVVKRGRSRVRTRSAPPALRDAHETCRHRHGRPYRPRQERPGAGVDRDRSGPAERGEGAGASRSTWASRTGRRPASAWRSWTCRDTNDSSRTCWPEPAASTR